MFAAAGGDVVSAQSFLDGRVTLFAGDSREVLRGVADASIDSVVTDPPYALVSVKQRFQNSPRSDSTENQENPYGRTGRGFMGQRWDTGEVAFSVEFWAQVLRVLKPGGHVVGFGGTRSHHRMWTAIEDAGFEIRDSLLYLFDLDPIVAAFFASLDPGQQQSFLYIMDQFGPGGMLAWVYGSGFPKSHNQKDSWAGWGTALKPAWEPIVLARKPLGGTVAANVLAHGTGALNIDGCRVHAEDAQGGVYEIKRFKPGATLDKTGGTWKPEGDGPLYQGEMKPGRWPANIVHDGSDEVVAAFPSAAGGSGKASGASLRGANCSVARGQFNGLPDGVDPAFYGDTGSAARFFYSAKADAQDRIGSKHPTVKPVDLMQWLCRLVTPPGGTVLDPFAGSGSTGEAAWREGFSALLIEREETYRADIARRLAHCLAGPATRKATIAAAKAPAPLGGLFAEAAE